MYRTTTPMMRHAVVCSDRHHPSTKAQSSVCVCVCTFVCMCMRVVVFICECVYVHTCVFVCMCTTFLWSFTLAYYRFLNSMLWLVHSLPPHTPLSRSNHGRTLLAQVCVM